MYTTLNKIKKHKPCPKGWKKLLKNLGKTKSDNELLHLSFILESNGINDALWTFRTIKEKDIEFRLMAADFAEFSLPIFEKRHSNDNRPRLAINAARDYANGKINLNELHAARDAARDAAWAPAWAAANGDAMDAARDAAWVAARDVARDATNSNEWNASISNEWDAARDAAWEKIIEIFKTHINNGTNNHHINTLTISNK